MRHATLKIFFPNNLHEISTNHALNTLHIMKFYDILCAHSQVPEWWNGRHDGLKIRCRSKA